MDLENFELCAKSLIINIGPATPEKETGKGRQRGKGVLSEKINVEPGIPLLHGQILQPVSRESGRYDSEMHV